MSNTTKIIITADDFGFCKEVDDGILEAARNGLINSVAALPNGPQNIERLKLLKAVQDNYVGKKIEHEDSKVDHFDVGCHFTITSGKAITKEARENGYLSKEGYFRSYTELRRPKTAEGIAKLNQILKKELIAQLNVFKGIVKVTHLSSHHDSLVFFPDYYNTFLEVAKEFNIAVRSPVMLPKSREKSYYGQIGLRLTDDLKKTERKKYRNFRKSRLQKRVDLTEGLKSPDFLFGGNYVTRSLLSGIWEERPQKGVALAKRHKYYKPRYKNNSQNHLDIDSLDDKKPLEMNGKVVEICAHLISTSHTINFSDGGPLFTRKTIGSVENENYYPGVTSSYFDGREIEYRLLELLKSRIFEDDTIEFTSWNSL